MAEIDESIAPGIVLTGSESLTALNRSEIDIQIATAKRFPRSIKEFQDRSLELAILDEETAATMFYKIPRSGKMIEGPSVRLAEIVATAYKNLRAESRIVAIDDNFLTAQGSAMDLENNFAARVEIKRRITDKSGKRFSDDMIAVTANAAASIALREAIFKVIPRALIKPIYEKTKAVAIGNAKSIGAKRTKALEWFAKVGATEDAVLAKLGRKGISDVTLEDLELLAGLLTAIRDGEISVEEALKVDAEDANRPESRSPTDLNRAVTEAAKKIKERPGEAKTEPAPINDLPNWDQLSEEQKEEIRAQAMLEEKRARAQG